MLTYLGKATLAGLMCSTVFCMLLILLVAGLEISDKISIFDALIGGIIFVGFLSVVFIVPTGTVLGLGAGFVAKYFRRGEKSSDPDSPWAFAIVHGLAGAIFSIPMTPLIASTVMTGLPAAHVWVSAVVICGIVYTGLSYGAARLFIYRRGPASPRPLSSATRYFPRQSSAEPLAGPRPTDYESAAITSRPPL
jgi:hypothetical protein